MVNTKRKFLGVGGYLKLGEWWRTQHPAMLAAKRTYVDAAALASKDLKCEINDLHCARIARELGMELASAHSRKTREEDRQDSRVARLERLVVALYAKLGEPVPDDQPTLPAMA